MNDKPLFEKNGDEDDFSVTSGDEPSTANVPFTPPPEKPDPIIRPADESDVPIGEDDRPEETHDLEDDSTKRASEGEGQEGEVEAP